MGEKVSSADEAQQAGRGGRGGSSSSSAGSGSASSSGSQTLSEEGDAAAAASVAGGAASASAAPAEPRGGSSGGCFNRDGPLSRSTPERQEAPRFPPRDEARGEAGGAEGTEQRRGSAEEEEGEEGDSAGGVYVGVGGAFRPESGASLEEQDEEVRGRWPCEGRLREGAARGLREPAGAEPLGGRGRGQGSRG